MIPSIPIQFLITVVLAYLLGSLPNAVWMVRVFSGVDIRKKGSGNPGATNVLRTMGWRLALPVFVADVTKGAVAIWMSGLIVPNDYIYPAVTALVILGHQYPLFAHFRGGRGVSTAAGVLLVLDWRVLIVGLIIFLVMVWRFRIVSVASLAAACSSVCTGLLFILIINGWGYLPVFLSILLIVVLLVIGHGDNIRRLREGREEPIEV